MFRAVFPLIIRSSKTVHAASGTSQSCLMRPLAWVSRNVASRWLYLRILFFLGSSNWFRTLKECSLRSTIGSFNTSQFSASLQIPPVLHVYLHVSLIRRIKVRSVGTFQKTVQFRKLRSMGFKILSGLQSGNDP
jgi:hypothetical protein